MMIWNVTTLFSWLNIRSARRRKDDMSSIKKGWLNNVLVAGNGATFVPVEIVVVEQMGVLLKAMVAVSIYVDIQLLCKLLCPNNALGAKFWYNQVAGNSFWREEAVWDEGVSRQTWEGATQPTCEELLKLDDSKIRVAISARWMDWLGCLKALTSQYSWWGIVPSAKFWGALSHFQEVQSELKRRIISDESPKCHKGIIDSKCGITEKYCNFLVCSIFSIDHICQPEFIIWSPPFTFCLALS